MLLWLCIHGLGYYSLTQPNKLFSFVFTNNKEMHLMKVTFGLGISAESPVPKESLAEFGAVPK